MAVIDARNSSAIVDLRNTSLWDRTNADSTNGSGTVLSYNGTVGDIYDLDFNGSSLARGPLATDALTAGTITGFDNNLDGGGGTSVEDISITGLNISAVGFNDTVEGMWLLALSGDDTFYAADDFNSFMFGDGLSTAADTSLIAGDDTFNGSLTANSRFYGDVYVNNGFLIGGDDVIIDAASGNDSDATVGDVQTNNGTVIGGNDIISLRDVANQNDYAVGDVQDNNAGATVIGGDDIMTLERGNTTGINQLFGDVVFSGSRSVIIGGDDQLFGSDARDILWGDSFSASGYIEGGNDIIYGYDGNDGIFADTEFTSGQVLAGNDIVYGGEGNDVIGGDVRGGTTSELGLIIREGFGDDMLYGEAGMDTIRGHVGDDFISGGADADTLDGGSGFDTADYSDSSAGVTVRLFNGTGLGGDAEGDTLANFEAVNGSAFVDTLIGSSTTDDRLFGDAGDDSLLGLAGNDTLIGGAGADTLDGGASLFDVADYSTSDAGVTVRLFNNVNVGGDAEGDMISNIEGITGSDFNDTLIGSSTQIDTIRGGDGNDALFGLAGNDTLNGGAGADVIDGGASNKDTVDYSDASEGVIIRLFNGTGERGEAEGDMISNVERVVGSEFNDTLIGANSLTDFLEGGNGNDSLFGLSGNDFLEGQVGDDIMDGGAGFDRLFGGEGDDTMTGGTESDTFFFEDDSGNDSITDFENGIDFIDVSGITGITSVADFVSIGQVGNDVVVQIDADNAITIENILVGNVDPTDFIFA